MRRSSVLKKSAPNWSKKLSSVLKRPNKPPPKKKLMHFKYKESSLRRLPKPSARRWSNSQLLIHRKK